MNNTKIIILTEGLKYKNKITGNVVKIKTFANYTSPTDGIVILVLYRDYIRVGLNKERKMLKAKSYKDFCNEFEELN